MSSELKWRDYIVEKHLNVIKMCARHIKKQTPSKACVKLLNTAISAGASVDNSQMVKLIIQYFQELETPEFRQLATEISSTCGISLNDNAGSELSKLITSKSPVNNLAQVSTQHKIYELIETIKHTKAGDTEKQEQGPSISYDRVQILIYKHLFLETLYLDKNPAKALSILRRIQDTAKDLKEQLSRLLLESPKDPESSLEKETLNRQLLKRLHWKTGDDFATSRRVLLQEIFNELPALEFPDPHRLPVLIDQALRYQQMQNPYFYPPIDQRKQASGIFRDYNRLLSTDEKLDRLPIHIKRTLEDHKDEIWYVCYSNDGKYLATGSVDHNITIYDASDEYSVYKQLTGHSGSIVYLSWSSDDTKLISTSFDQTVRIWDVHSTESKTLPNQNFFKSYIRIWPAEFVGNGYNFIFGSPDKELAIFDEDGYVVHDFRTEYRIDDITVLSKDLMIAITHSFDILLVRITANKYEILNTIHVGLRLTAVSHAPNDSTHFLVSAKPDELQVWNVADPLMPYLENKYYGFEGSDFVIRSCLFDENLVLSGSDNGRIYVWNRKYGNLITTLPGHKSLVNCIAWRPNPGHTRSSCEWASGGDDAKVMIWGYNN